MMPIAEGRITLPAIADGFFFAITLRFSALMPQHFALTFSTDFLMFDAAADADFLSAPAFARFTPFEPAYFAVPA